MRPHARDKKCYCYKDSSKTALMMKISRKDEENKHKTFF